MFYLSLYFQCEDDPQVARHGDNGPSPSSSAVPYERFRDDTDERLLNSEW